MHRNRKKTIFHMHARLQNINSSFCNFGNMMTTKLTPCCLKMCYPKSQYLSSVLVVYHGDKGYYLSIVSGLCAHFGTHSNSKSILQQETIGGKIDSP